MDARRVMFDAINTFLQTAELDALVSFSTAIKEVQKYIESKPAVDKDDLLLAFRVITSSAEMIHYSRRQEEGVSQKNHKIESTVAGNVGSVEDEL